MLPSMSGGPQAIDIKKAGEERWRWRSLHNTAPEQNQDQEDQEAKARLRAQQEQRHLQTYWNMHRFRNYLYHRYASLLKEKLHSQRLQQDCVRAPPKASSGIKQKKHKTAFSKLQHNDQYLKAIPKTSYYLIFDLQKELVQHGHLQSHQELENFYNCISYNSHPSKLQRSLLDVKRKMLDKRPAVTIPGRWETPQPCADEDTGHKDISDTRLARRGSESEQRVSEMAFSSCLEKDEFEQTLPKMKMPTFLTLQPNFMRSFRTTLPDLVGQTTLKIPNKSRKAEIYLKQLKEMHIQCLANMRSSQRLLDRKIDSLCWLEGQDVKKLTLPDIDSHKKTRQSKQSTPTSLQPLTVNNNPPPSAHVLNKNFQKVDTNPQCLESEVWDKAVRCSTTPEPLCIEDVYRQKHAEVIDGGLKFWKNIKISESE